MSKLTVGELAGLADNNYQIGIAAGSSLYVPGSIVQVVQNNITDRLSQSLSAQTVNDVSGFSASITPKSTSSKVLVMVRWFGEFSAQDQNWNTIWGLKRNGTRVGEQPSPGSTAATAITMSALSYYSNDGNSTPEMLSFSYLDSPNTTSSVTYQIFAIPETGTSISTNRVWGWNNQTYGYELGTSNIILMEVAG